MPPKILPLPSHKSQSGHFTVGLGAASSALTVSSELVSSSAMKVTTDDDADGTRSGVGDAPVAYAERQAAGTKADVSDASARARRTIADILGFIFERRAYSAMKQAVGGRGNSQRSRCVHSLEESINCLEMRERERELYCRKSYERLWRQYLSCRY
mmetsp:Transcript_1056/g.2290  ORF Transcript_1056/g.2290 Transcript_1056/m.2290 type:complete len:156 (-) Transcript_1056:38-505(-)